MATSQSVEITELPTIVTPSLTDVVPAVNNGVTVQEALLQIMLLFGANIQIASPNQITGLTTILLTWNHVTTATKVMVSNNGYVTDDSASLVNYSLPTTSVLGDQIIIVGRSSLGWTVSQSAGQQIIIGSHSTTIGVAGGISSSNKSDSISLICTLANLEWTAQVAPQGNISIA